jgi:H+-translocating NAD(P) transhydrogenase subunit alpha
MIIGIPKEILPNEKRVAATPETVEKYRKLGFEVQVQTGAGEGIFFYDEDYRKAGAQIVDAVEELFLTSDVVLKVKQPYFNSVVGKHEADMLREGSTLVTFLHPAARDNHEMAKKLRDRNITSFTMDGIPRISRAQRMDALTSMSTVSGYKSVLMAACRLPRFFPMIGTAIGVIKPANVLVVGAGVVGLQAIATAKRLGAVVRALDIREEARTEAASLGAKVVGFDVPAELSKGEGGYAKALPDEWLDKEVEAIAPFVKEADIIILSALIPGSLAPVLVTEKMVEGMSPGAIIIDVSIDQGGNCALTVPGKEIEAHGVTVSGIQNIPGSVAVHATWLYAQNLYYYIENLFPQGPGPMNFEDEIVKSSLVTHNRQILFKGLLAVLKE